MKLIESKGNIALISDSGQEEAIHVFHNDYTLDEYMEDIWHPYVVAEGGHGNSARLHLTTAESEYAALEIVQTYLTEKEGVAPDEIDLQGVTVVEL